MLVWFACLCVCVFVSFTCLCVCLSFACLFVCVFVSFACLCVCVCVYVNMNLDITYTRKTIKDKRVGSRKRLSKMEGEKQE